MKFYAFLCFAILFANVSFAQKNSFSPSNTRYNIKIGLNTSFIGDRFGFTAAGEFKVAKRQSIQIELLPIFINDGYEKRNGFGTAISYRKYLSRNKEGIQGIYFSPAVKYSSLNSIVGNSIIEKVKHTNIAILFGKQWVYKSGFSLDINGGMGYYNFTEKNNYSSWANASTSTNNYYGLSPNINIKVGFAF